jgi:hypothetical protein
MPAQLGPIDCHKYRDHLLDEDWLRCVEAMFDLRQQQNYWLWMAFLYLLRPLVWVLCGGWLRQFILQDLLFDGLLSEHRVAVYVRSAREVLWPAGVWADAAPQKTDDQRRLTRLALEAEMKKLLTPGK